MGWLSAVVPTLSTLSLFLFVPQEIAGKVLRKRPTLPVVPTLYTLSLFLFVPQEIAGKVLRKRPTLSHPNLI